MPVERHIDVITYPVIFPDRLTWQDQVAAARAMIECAWDRVTQKDEEALAGMKRLHKLIYSHKIGVESPYEEFENNAFSVFNGSVEYAQTRSTFPGHEIIRGGKKFISFDKTPGGVINLRDVKLISDAYGLAQAPKPVRQLAAPGMSNPNHALIEARFQLSVALRDKFRK